MKFRASLPFSEAAQAWLESQELAGNVDKARYIAPRTMRDYQQYIGALIPFFGTMPLEHIHGGHLRQYQTERSERAGPLKVNQELGLLRRILEQCDLWGRAIRDCYQPLQVAESDVPRAMSPEEQGRFLEVAASRARWSLVYWYSLVALQTTCSNCEMRGLHLGDVNMSDQVLQVRAARAKNKYRVRTIPLSPDALWALERIHERAWALGARAPGHYLFPFCLAATRFVRSQPTSWDPTRPMTECGIKRPFNEIRREAGVPWLRVHDLRHTAITRMAEAGVPIATIMSCAGHVSRKMTEHYTSIGEAAKRKAIMQAFDRRPASADHLEAKPLRNASAGLETRAIALAGHPVLPRSGSKDV